ncbi:hypothetical protein HHK36_006462 [Tetracentron sinense]|uniref:peptidyl-tRNA hydrolase n=1 Tax=Tetracentron sinense TaxID=13715 RepID=A0A834ZKY5_TETSI|nr:hypothetical protein HHK36_006462 [Tetracentron sinense]
MVAVAQLVPRISLPAIHYYYSSSSSRLRVRTRVSLPVSNWFRSWSRYCSEQMNNSTTGAAEETRSLPSDAGNRVGESQISDVLVQYVVLRRDLIDSWPLGSVVTQGCHASVSAIWTHKDDAHTADYCSPGNLHSMHKARFFHVFLKLCLEASLKAKEEKNSTGLVRSCLFIHSIGNILRCLKTNIYQFSTLFEFFNDLNNCERVSSVVRVEVKER